MADSDQNPKNLGEILRYIFEGLATDDLKKKISIEQAIAEASQYGDLTKLIRDHKEDILLIRNNGLPTAEKEELLALLFGSEVLQFLESTQGPDLELSEVDKRTMADGITDGLKKIETSLETHEESRATVMRNFIRASVGKFAGSDVESVVKRAMEESMEPMLLDSSAASLQKRAQQALGNALRKHNITATPTEVYETTQQFGSQLNKLAEHNATIETLKGASPLILESAGRVKNPNMLANIVIGQIELADASALQSALIQTKATEAFRLSNEAVGDFLKNESLSNIVKKAGLTQATDFIATKPQLQNAGISTVLKNALDSVELKISTGTLRIGGASTETLTELISRANQAFTQVGGMTPGLAQNLSSALSNLSLEFKGADNVIVAYLSEGSRNLSSPDQIQSIISHNKLSPQQASELWDHFFVALVHSHSDNLYIKTDASSHAVLSWLPNLPVFAKPTSTAVSSGSTRLATGAAGDTVIAKLTAYFTELAGLKGISGTVGKFGLVFLRIFAIPLRWLIVIGITLFPKLTRAVGGVVGNALSKLVAGQFGFWAPGPAGVAGYFTGFQQTKSDRNISLGIASLIAMLFVSGIVAVMLMFGVESGSRAIGLGGGGYSGAGIDFTGGTPPAEGIITEITNCPVERGSITQAPNGSHSHTNRNAYDFGVNYGAVIRASHAGNVAVAGCDGIWVRCDSEHPDWKGYGNFVVLIGRHADGGVFYTHYAHLATINPNILDGVVEAGEEIGTADSTGYSDGNHLHFQYRGPKGMAPFLPAGCP